MSEQPWDTTIRGVAVKLPDTCVVCDNFRFVRWGVVHGRAICRCGAGYQLKPTTEEDWDDVPYDLIDRDYLEACREKVEEEGTLEGFNEWYEENYDD